MGLSHAEQSEIEDSFWVPIEQNTGESIGSFWRHYLVMRTGREVAVVGERGVYDAFRAEFPRLDLESLRAHAVEWKEYSEIYRVLLDPAHALEADVGAPARLPQHLRPRHVPARDARLPRPPARRTIDKGTLIRTIEYVQSLLLRRTVVGVSNDRLVARLCRAREDGQDSLARAIAASRRRTSACGSR